MIRRSVMSQSSPQCLIVGASGFIGRRLVQRFALGGAMVDAWSRTAAPEFKSSGTVRWRSVDLRAPGDLPPAPEGGWDCVMHFAGHSRPRQTNAHTDVLDTTRMLSRVLHHIERVSPRARFLFNSSGHVYAPASTPRDEEAPTYPHSAYALSKLLCETLVQERSDRLHVVVVRAFNLLGPGMPQGLLVPDFLRTLSTGSTQIAMAGSNSWRDFLDLRDAVDAYYALASVPCASGAVFNLCSGRASRVAELLSAIAAARGIAAQLSFRDSTEEHLLGDPSRLCAATGWAPRRSLSDAAASIAGALDG